MIKTGVSYSKGQITLNNKLFLLVPCVNTKYREKNIKFLEKIPDIYNLLTLKFRKSSLSDKESRCCMINPLLCFFQLTVVVKYFFQFGFFPWTTSAYRGINAERPFALPNIIGVEKKDGYVLFDLIQLLALFFHRSILKVTMKKFICSLKYTHLQLYVLQRLR